MEISLAGVTAKRLVANNFNTKHRFHDFFVESLSMAGCLRLVPGIDIFQKYIKSIWYLVRTHAAYNCRNVEKRYGVSVLLLLYIYLQVPE